MFPQFRNDSFPMFIYVFPLFLFPSPKIQFEYEKTTNIFLLHKPKSRYHGIRIIKKKNHYVYKKVWIIKKKNLSLTAIESHVFALQSRTETFNSPYFHSFMRPMVFPISRIAVPTTRNDLNHTGTPSPFFRFSERIPDSFHRLAKPDADPSRDRAPTLGRFQLGVVFYDSSPPVNHASFAWCHTIRRIFPISSADTSVTRLSFWRKGAVREAVKPYEFRANAIIRKRVYFVYETRYRVAQKWHVRVREFAYTAYFCV